MNIEFIKSEIKRLSLIVEDWREGESVPTIERDLALDKIKSLYNILRFGEAEGAAEQYAIPVAPPVADDNAAEECDAPEEKDVEVEFIFAEEDEEDTVDEVESEEEQSANDEITETATEIAAATINVGMPEPTPAAEEPKQEAADVAEPIVVEQPTVVPEIAEKEPAVIEDKKPTVEEKSKATASINSLFGADEPRREPRSKHQRMMSIYNDEPKPEKVVDISKIFDMDDESDVEIFATPTPKTQPQVKRVVEYDEEPLKSGETIADVKTVTLADTMAQNATTLADTIAAPAALGEEINHSHIKSLRKAIGINDKFLMIRDLFGGDGDVYEQTLDALDEFESFDDCLLYIAENHPEWNPDSEGAKFLTQLLERKLL